MKSLFDLTLLHKGSSSQILSEIDKTRPKLGSLKQPYLSNLSKVEKIQYSEQILRTIENSGTDAKKTFLCVLSWLPALLLSFLDCGKKVKNNSYGPLINNLSFYHKI